ncbi:hypothetical protein B0A49_02928, partial [Cryomyces minteri]
MATPLITEAAVDTPDEEATLVVEVPDVVAMEEAPDEVGPDVDATVVDEPVEETLDVAVALDPEAVLTLPVAVEVLDDVRPLTEVEPGRPVAVVLAEPDELALLTLLVADEAVSGTAGVATVELAEVPVDTDIEIALPEGEDISITLPVDTVLVAALPVEIGVDEGLPMITDVETVRLLAGVAVDGASLVETGTAVAGVPEVVGEEALVVCEATDETTEETTDDAEDKAEETPDVTGTGTSVTVGVVAMVEAGEPLLAVSPGGVDAGKAVSIGRWLETPDIKDADSLARMLENSDERTEDTARSVAVAAMLESSELRYDARPDITLETTAVTGNGAPGDRVAAMLEAAESIEDSASEIADDAADPTDDTTLARLVETGKTVDGVDPDKRGVNADDEPSNAVAEAAAEVFGAITAIPDGPLVGVKVFKVLVAMPDDAEAGTDADVTGVPAVVAEDTTDVVAGADDPLAVASEDPATRRGVDVADARSAVVPETGPLVAGEAGADALSEATTVVPTVAGALLLMKVDNPTIMAAVDVADSGAEVNKTVEGLVGRTTLGGTCPMEPTDVDAFAVSETGVVLGSALLGATKLDDATWPDSDEDGGKALAGTGETVMVTGAAIRVKLLSDDSEETAGLGADPDATLPEAAGIEPLVETVGRTITSGTPPLDPALTNDLAAVEKLTVGRTTVGGKPPLDPGTSLDEDSTAE